MKNKPVAIFADGEPPRLDIIKKHLPERALIIAADGGANSCKRLNIEADYIIGDFDSVHKDVKKAFSKSALLSRPDQNYTDMQKALEFASSLHPSKIFVFGAYGLRKDHAIGNLLVFQNYTNDIPLEIIDNYGKMFFLTAGRHTLQGLKGDTISLISFYPLKQLTLEGFRYKLDKKDFIHSFLGVSNVAESDGCIIDFSEGLIVVYQVF